jgi:hypothetical protein
LIADFRFAIEELQRMRSRDQDQEFKIKNRKSKIKNAIGGEAR